MKTVIIKDRDGKKLIRVSHKKGHYEVEKRGDLDELIVTIITPENSRVNIRR